MKDNNSRIMRK